MKHKYKEKLIYLQPMSKDFLIRITAVAVCLWYSLCIMGFDLHTCTSAGHTYVSSVFKTEGECLSIHPDEACGAGEDLCLESHVPALMVGEQISNAACCSDEFEQLQDIYLPQNNICRQVVAFLLAAPAATVGTVVVPSPSFRPLSGQDFPERPHPVKPDPFLFLQVFRI